MNPLSINIYSKNIFFSALCFLRNDNTLKVSPSIRRMNELRFRYIHIDFIQLTILCLCIFLPKMSIYFLNEVFCFIVCRGKIKFAVYFHHCIGIFYLNIMNKPIQCFLCLCKFFFRDRILSTYPVVIIRWQNIFNGMSGYS